MRFGARQSAGPTALTIIVVVGLAGLAATSGQERRREGAISRPPAPAAVAAFGAPRACATPWGLCPILRVRVGDPCACPHPLHGTVQGRAISLGDAVTPAIGRQHGDDADGQPLRLGPRRDE